MEHRHSIPLVMLVLLAAVSCVDSTGPVSIDTEWSGVVGQGDAIEIKGFNGDIIASQTSGNAVIVTATKEGRFSDPSTVDIVAIMHSGGVTICAMYPDAPDQPANECAPGADGYMNVDRNDVEVTFQVSVPAGVDFVGYTVNGSVIATDLDSDASGYAVNGDIGISTSQIATGYSVNGSVTASIGLTDWADDLTFATVNGSVSVRVPPGTNAEVSMVTVNGSVNTDAPFTVITPGNIRCVLGTGASTLNINSVNGNLWMDSGL